MSFTWGATTAPRIDPTVEPPVVPGVGGHPPVPGVDDGDIDNVVDVVDTTNRAGAADNPTVPVAN